MLLLQAYNVIIPINQPCNAHNACVANYIASKGSMDNHQSEEYKMII